MAKIPYEKLPKALTPSKALAGLLGAAAIQYLVILVDFEGYVPIGYLDPVNIPTKCVGDTRNVKVGHRYSFAECEKSINEHSVEIIKPIRKCIKNFDKLPDKTKASLASMAYNIGPNAMCNSSVAKYANAGNLTRMCTRISEIYLYATDRKTGEKKVLRGLKIRRDKESALCLEGLKEAENEKNNVLTEISAETDRLYPSDAVDTVSNQGEVVGQDPVVPPFFDRFRIYFHDFVQSIFRRSDSSS